MNVYQFYKKQTIQKVFIIIIIVAVLLCTIKVIYIMMPLNIVEINKTLPAMYYLNELEKADERTKIYNRNTLALLAKNVLPKDKLDIKITNKFVTTFSNDLHLIITNNTDYDISISAVNLDGLEVYQNGEWLALSAKKNTVVDALACEILPGISIKYNLSLNQYFLKKGRYRAVVGYFNRDVYIVDTIEFTISGLF